MKKNFENLPIREQVPAEKLLRRVKELMDSCDLAEGMGEGLRHDKVFQAIKWAYDKGTPFTGQPDIFPGLVEGWLLTHEETAQSAFRLKILYPQAYNAVLEIVVSEYWKRLIMAL